VEELLTQALLYLPMLWLALTVHEAAHAWAAERLGDPSAREAGRLSLLPFSHLDLMGSVAIPLALLLAQASFFLGYAKPTPVDPGRLRGGKNGFALAAAAGPLANLLLAVAFSLLGALLLGAFGLEDRPLQMLLGAGIVLNGILAALNLLPLPGFDGIKVLYAVLPDAWCWQLHRQERLYPVLLILLAWAFDRVLVVLWPAYWLVARLSEFAGIPLPLL
jgi:Zn-dependent protease